MEKADVPNSNNCSDDGCHQNLFLIEARQPTLSASIDAAMPVRHGMLALDAEHNDAAVQLHAGEESMLGNGLTPNCDENDINGDNAVAVTTPEMSEVEAVPSVASTIFVDNEDDDANEMLSGHMGDGVTFVQGSGVHRGIPSTVVEELLTTNKENVPPDFFHAPLASQYEVSYVAHGRKGMEQRWSRSQGAPFSVSGVATNSNVMCEGGIGSVEVNSRASRNGGESPKGDKARQRKKRVRTPLRKKRRVPLRDITAAVVREGAQADGSSGVEFPADMVEIHGGEDSDWNTGVTSSVFGVRDLSRAGRTQALRFGMR